VVGNLKRIKLDPSFHYHFVAFSCAVLPAKRYAWCFKQLPKTYVCLCGIEDSFNQVLTSKDLQYIYEWYLQKARHFWPLRRPWYARWKCKVPWIKRSILHTKCTVFHTTKYWKLTHMQCLCPLQVVATSQWWSFLELGSLANIMQPYYKMIKAVVRSKGVF
jgi:hypothetical protein